MWEPPGIGYFVIQFILVVFISVISLWAGSRVARFSIARSRTCFLVVGSLLGALGGCLLMYQLIDWIPKLATFIPRLPLAVRPLAFLPIGFLYDVLVRKHSNCGTWGFDPRGWHREFRLLIMLIGLTAFAILEGPLYLVYKGGSLVQLKGERNDGVCLQSTPFSCVSASGVTALHALGIDCTEGELLFRTRTSWHGSGFVDLQRAVKSLAQSRGLSIDTKIETLNWDELKSLETPVVLGTTWKGFIPHATALIGFDGDQAILGEPLEGKVLATEYELRGEKWQWKGKAMIFHKR